MNIEDLICQLHSHCKVNRFDTNLVDSFVMQVFAGNGFTQKQTVLVLKILNRYSKSLSAALNLDVQPFLDNPSYRYPIRSSGTNAKRLSIIDHQLWGRAIKAEFPFDQEKIDSIRKKKESLGFAQWNGEERAWLFSVDERNLQFLKNFVQNDKFEVDAEIQNYFDQVEKIVNDMEKYIPMLTIENGLPKYQNVNRFVPKLTSFDVVSALFEARKAGIFTWDEKVNQYIDTVGLNPVVKEYLGNENVGICEIDSTKYPVECLTEIVKYAQPALFIVPGGSESAKTKMIYNFLISLGFSSDEMSVMFRLPSSEGREFNEFVKNCAINNPISDRTKFVFISIKMPKPILKSKIKFNSIIGLGKSNVHYTIREYFKNQTNLIYYCESSRQKEFNFGNL